ncbi:hypothetical protein Tco_1229966 [Tanacetum coccineum]
MGKSCGPTLYILQNYEFTNIIVDVLSNVFSGDQRDAMELELDIENITIKEYLEYESEKLDDHTYGFTSKFYDQSQCTPNPQLEDKKLSLEEDIVIGDVARLEWLLTPTVQALPKPNSVVQPYVPSTSFHNELKVVRQKEPIRNLLEKMEVRNLRIEEAIPRANVESITKQNSSISNPSFISSTNDIVSVPIQVSKVKDDILQPLTSQDIHITPPDDTYVVSATSLILDDLLEEFEDELLDIIVEEDCNPTRDIEELKRLLVKHYQSSLMEIKVLSCIMKTNEEFESYILIQKLSPLYRVFKSSESSTKPSKVGWKMKYPCR